MTHLDLFSGIGGFAYAADQVWEDVEHIFCEIDPFCRKVLTKHWPEAKQYGDIKEITGGHADLVTGGFPCQPFSDAGLRKGRADDRWLWPEMLRVICLTKPTWVIVENVRGLITIESGMVFEQVFSDLEAAGYEVQPLVIPAASVNAPHKRERVWFLAHAKHARPYETQDPESDSQGTDGDKKRAYELKQLKGLDSIRPEPSPSWDTDWEDFAARVCRVDDGLPNRVDRIKSLGNAIVPQVAVEIMKGMKL